jgi:hypothetical protein
MHIHSIEIDQTLTTAFGAHASLAGTKRTMSSTLATEILDHLK